MSSSFVNENQYPLRVIQGWSSSLKIKSVEQMPAGFSGALVYRCRDARGNSFALKRWPVGTKPQRVQQVHEIVAQARGSGCPSLPHVTQSSTGLSFVVDDNNGCWEMSEWMKGEPLPRVATAASVAAGAAAIASFHRAVAQSELGNRSRGTAIPSPAVTARFDRLQQLQRELPRAMAVALPPSMSPPLADAVNRAREILGTRWRSVAPQIHRDLNSWTSHLVTTQYVLRDVHRKHVLFAEDSGTLKPQGIIDFDAIQQDCPAVDLARWVGSFRDDSGAQLGYLRAAVAGYQRNWQFKDEQISLAQMLLHASSWVNLANWVVWMSLRTRSFDNDELAIAGRISELVEQITDVP